MTDVLHVACAVEGRYDAHSAVMLHSLLTDGGPLPVHVHLLHGPGLKQRSLRRLQAMVADHHGELTAHEIDPRRFAGFRIVPEFTVAMWFRILLPELLPDVDRVLYLDVDTLVCDDLRPLWATDLTGHDLAAVTNVFMPYHQHRPAEVGIAPDAYFNSGVLLFNLDQMRRDDATARLSEVATTRAAELAWPDQDALNLVLGAKRHALHPRWNAMNSLRLPEGAGVFGETVVQEALANPAIRHFEGPGQNKPWHRRAEPEDRERYEAHRRETPWRRRFRP